MAKMCASAHTLDQQPRSQIGFTASSTNTPGGPNNQINNSSHSHDQLLDNHQQVTNQTDRTVRLLTDYIVFVKFGLLEKLSGAKTQLFCSKSTAKVPAGSCRAHGLQKYIRPYSMGFSYNLITGCYMKSITT